MPNNSKAIVSEEVDSRVDRLGEGGVEGGHGSDGNDSVGGIGNCSCQFLLNLANELPISLQRHSYRRSGCCDGCSDGESGEGAQCSVRGDGLGGIDDHASHGSDCDCEGKRLARRVQRN